MRFAYFPYRRRFKSPLTTHHGTWAWREGAIVRFAGQAGVGWGEIAPLPWFGTETLAEAIAFCETFASPESPDWTAADWTRAIAAIPDRLPCCQFAIESAWATIEPTIEPIHPDSTNPDSTNPATEPGPSHFESLPARSIAALLPQGDRALTAWPDAWNQGHRTFKLKIGLGQDPASAEAERATIDRLLNQLPPGAIVRLDANGGLTADQAKHWLAWCDRHGPVSPNPADRPCVDQTDADRAYIEFLEQPCAPDSLPTMLSLAANFQTAIALDESVATIDQLAAVVAAGWLGPLVLKPAIAGSPSRLRTWAEAQPRSIDGVISSVFETPIGRSAALRLGQSLARAGDRAFGFGTDTWLEPCHWPDILKP